MMNTKPLIGVSLLAVVLLVMGSSLSNVVGYQSVSSTTVDDSPLFQTRSQRATNQQQNILSSQYLGIGRGNPLQFQLRDSRTEQLNKAIDLISKMDDKSFAQFTEMCIQRAKEDSNLRDTNSNEIIRKLNALRTTPEIILDFQGNRYNQDATLSGGGITVCPWFPGCYLMMIIMVLLYIEYLYRTSLLPC